ncbi:hypothetical protein COL516b_007776 [Colletotrichum fioriniae]|nr:uncharacterized protein COL516b_007776 [Colletotrichum fioriniae]KAJ0301376.1 hypothetical protein COL516b_007776 [Colletotrichum fioriniae]
MDAEVIITTLGGGRERDVDGNMIRVKEGFERNLSSAQASMMKAMPVGVILGKSFLFAGTLYLDNILISK